MSDTQTRLQAELRGVRETVAEALQTFEDRTGLTVTKVEIYRPEGHALEVLITSILTLKRKGN